MNSLLVPAVDGTAVPAPLWLFQFLLVFTFILHALFMNLALGGTLLAAFSQMRARDARDPRLHVARRLMGMNTYGISMAITTGIAPLLFVQVLYQQYFYSATILIGNAWLLLVGLLMVGYYAVYVYKMRGAVAPEAKQPSGTGWLLLASLLFLIIAMIHVAVNLLHSQPGLWPQVASNPWSILGDRTYVPRLLHFVLAALGFSALVTAWWATRRARAGKDVELNRAIASYAWKWVLWTTLLQVVDGLLLTFVLPREVLLGLMEVQRIVPLTLALLLGLGILLMVARVGDPVQKPGVVGGTLGTMVVTIVIMAITRHQVRDLYLQPVSAQYELTTAPQWGNFALFALLLVVGLATVAYMVRQVLANPARGDQAA
jgi:hypothetical protein